VGTYSNPIDPRLGPLQDNGGPTQTMALLAGSPALDAGDPAQLGTADQRGVLRLGGVNIGAYQASAASFQLTLPPNQNIFYGNSFDLNVTAVDRFGELADGYRGRVHFSSDAPQGVMPADYTFTATDNGQHMFSFTLGSFGYLYPTNDVFYTITVSSGATGLIS